MPASLSTMSTLLCGDERRRAGEGRRERRGGSAQPKTRTPHKDVRKKETQHISMIDNPNQKVHDYFTDSKKINQLYPHYFIQGLISKP